jgi:DNA-binding transcriptional regulator YhcF (GntR family)
VNDDLATLTRISHSVEFSKSHFPMELAIPLLENGELLFRQMRPDLREAIHSSKLWAGDQLPSTRDLAQQLGVSRTVIVQAYEQLLAEGFVSDRTGPRTCESERLTCTSRHKETITKPEVFAFRQRSVSGGAIRVEVTGAHIVLWL